MARLLAPLITWTLVFLAIALMTQGVSAQPRPTPPKQSQGKPKPPSPAVVKKPAPDLNFLFAALQAAPDSESAQHVERIGELGELRRRGRALVRELQREAGLSAGLAAMHHVGLIAVHIVLRQLRRITACRRLKRLHQRGRVLIR